MRAKKILLTTIGLPADYPLYFFDVRANARDRVQHFFAGHEGIR